jgi:hypothetical protein
MKTLPIHYRLLRDYIDQALRIQGTEEAALHLARQLDAGKWDIISHFDVTDDGRPIADTLTYSVDVETRAGWLRICTVPWRYLGLEWADVQYELRNTLRQRDEGTYPGGPADPHQRGE